MTLNAALGFEHAGAASRIRRRRQQRRRQTEDEQKVSFHRESLTPVVTIWVRKL